VATRRVSENLQQGRAGAEGTGYDIEVTIPVKKSQEAQYNLDREYFFENRFWGRQPDGVAINEALHIVYI